MFLMICFLNTMFDRVPLRNSSICITRCVEYNWVAVLIMSIRFMLRLLIVMNLFLIIMIMVQLRLLLIIVLLLLVLGMPRRLHMCCLLLVRVLLMCCVSLLFCVVVWVFGF